MTLTPTTAGPGHTEPAPARRLAVRTDPGDAGPTGPGPRWVVR